MALTQISTAGVKDDAVTSGKIPANAVGSSELADNAVDTAAIQDNAVTNAKIANGNVSTLKIADDAVTVAKIQNFGQNQIAGRVASGSGNLQGLSASDVRTMINVEDGATNSTTTTINNNAANRVVTGSGTANTLTANSDLLWNGSRLDIDTGGTEDALRIGNSNGTDTFIRLGSIGTATDSHAVIKYSKADNYLSMLISGESHRDGGILIANGGNVGIGVQSHDPLTPLHVQGSNAGGLKDVLTITNENGGAGTTVGMVFECGADEVARISAANTGSDIGPLMFSTASSQTANPTEKMRITSDGKVAIGTDTPQSFFNVHNHAHYVPTDSGRATHHIHVRGANGNAGEFGGAISFSCGNGASSAAIAARQGGSDADYTGMSFFTHPSGVMANDAEEKVRIHHTGETSFNDGICLGNGLTLSSNHNLDDYEEGSWTPSVHAGGGTIGTIHNAKYTKIGRLVHVQCYFNYTAGSSGSAFQLGGLPFTVASNNYAAQAVDFQRVLYRGVYSRTHTGNTFMEFLFSAKSTSSDRITLKGNMIGTGYIILATTYMS